MSVEEQVKKYCQQMTEEKALHKSNESIKADLKKYLIDNNQKTSDVGIYHVILVEKSNDTLDETRAIDLLYEYWHSLHGEDVPCPWVTTVEVLNEDALERAIYSGELPKVVIKKLNTFRTHSVTHALNFKVDKEK